MKNISRFKKALSAVATLAIMALLVPSGSIDSDSLKANVLSHSEWFSATGASESPFLDMYTWVNETDEFNSGTTLNLGVHAMVMFNDENKDGIRQSTETRVELPLSSTASIGHPQHMLPAAEANCSPAILSAAGAVPIKAINRDLLMTLKIPYYQLMVTLIYLLLDKYHLRFLNF